MCNNNKQILMCSLELVYLDDNNDDNNNNNNQINN